jgi:hypothetical protein
MTSSAPGVFAPDSTDLVAAPSSLHLSRLRASQTVRLGGPPTPSNGEVGVLPEPEEPNVGRTYGERRQQLAAASCVLAAVAIVTCSSVTAAASGQSTRFDSAGSASTSSALPGARPIYAAPARRRDALPAQTRSTSSGLSWTRSTRPGQGSDPLLRRLGTPSADDLLARDGRAGVVTDVDHGRYRTGAGGSFVLPSDLSR